MENKGRGVEVKQDGGVPGETGGDGSSDICADGGKEESTGRA